jgi:hypothetical protein
MSCSQDILNSLSVDSLSALCYILLLRILTRWNGQNGGSLILTRTRDHIAGKSSFNIVLPQGIVSLSIGEEI